MSSEIEILAHKRLTERLIRLGSRLKLADIDSETMTTDNCLIGDISDKTFMNSKDFRSLGVRVDHSGAARNLVIAAREGNNNLQNLRIAAYGSDNVIYIGPNCKVVGLIRLHSTDSMCALCGNNRETSPINPTLWSKNATILVGSRTTSNGTQLVAMGDGASIVIGDDCMFSSGVWLKTSDMHAIVDLKTNQAINKYGNVGNITIGRHVWIGQDALVTLGVAIGAGAIVGAKSFVNRDVEAFALVAGVPARELRKGVTWTRAHKLLQEEYATIRRELDLDS